MRALEWYVARRYLAARKKGRFLSLITLIAVGGITVGVMALITVIAVMEGLQHDLQEKILGSTPHVYIFESAPSFRLGGWQEVMKRVQKIPGVITEEPFMMTDVGLINGRNNYAQPARLYGIDPYLARKPLTLVEDSIRAGIYALRPTRSGLPGVLLGAGLAGRMSLGPGDTVTIAGFEKVKIGATGDPVPKLMNFEVTGIFETGMYEYDTRNVYAEIPPVQALLEFPPDTVSGMAVKTTDAWHSQDVARAINAEMGFGYYAQDWTALNAPLFSALKLEKLGMGVILFLIVLVAAFNIVSTLIMVVSDKTREIGILKAMGMTDRMILRIFMLQGLAIGIFGTMLGALCGILLVTVIDRTGFITLPPEVYFIDRLPVLLDPKDFAVIVVLSILISFAATIYPARQASRLLPVEAIRHE
jgi:lipoprotein-releasing system permease protein